MLNRLKPHSFLILVLLFVGCLCACTESITTSSVGYIEKEGEHPGNLKQEESPIWIDSKNGELFVRAFYTDSSTYQEKIVAIGSDGVRTVSELDYDIVNVAMYGGYFYFTTCFEDSYQLNCIDVATGENTFLTETNLSIYTPIILKDDGIVYYPDGNYKDRFLPIYGNSCDNAIQMKQEYTIGGRTYSYNSFGELKLHDSAGEDTLIATMSQQADPLIYNDGLLLHTKNPGVLLSYLSPDGTMTDLFSVESEYVRSTLNFHGNQVFLSVMRVQLGPMQLGYVPYEEDDVSGTYRINMDDYSVTKISDAFYRGIYIFNSKHLYCVANTDHVVMTDFDGNVLQTIIGSEP